MQEDPAAFLVVLKRKISELTAIIDRYEKSLRVTIITGVEPVIAAFPQDLRDQLTFSETETHHIIRPKQYLGTDTFRKVAQIVKNQLAGEYVSAGKDSHFRVPKKAQP